MQIRRRQFEIIQEHAIGEHPYECCGLMAGYRRANRKGDMENVVCEIAPCINVLYSGREHGFEISYSEFMDVEREARAMGLEIVGSYHSHIDSAPVPSNNDINFASPGHSMLIIALEQRIPAGVTSWLRRDVGGFHQEPISVAEVG